MGASFDIDPNLARGPRHGLRRGHGAGHTGRLRAARHPRRGVLRRSLRRRCHPGHPGRTGVLPLVADLPGPPRLRGLAVAGGRVPARRPDRRAGRGLDGAQRAVAGRDPGGLALAERGGDPRAGRGARRPGPAPRREPTRLPGRSGRRGRHLRRLPRLGERRERGQRDRRAGRHRRRSRTGLVDRAGRRRPRRRGAAGGVVRRAPGRPLGDRRRDGLGAGLDRGGPPVRRTRVAAGRRRGGPGRAGDPRGDRGRPGPRTDAVRAAIGGRAPARDAS